MDELELNRFRAFIVTRDESGQLQRAVETVNPDILPDGDITVKVLFSGLNYKDALSAYGHPGVTRSYPHTPGIDAAGIIVQGRSAKFTIGDKVIVSSYDLGMNTNGGFGQFIRVPEEWIVKLPAGLSLRESMIAGTGGLTAAQGVYNLLEAGQKPEDGPVVVTGARGAVGSYAVSLLAKLGFEVIAAVSEKGDDTDKIKSLGAYDVIDKSLTDDKTGKALLKARWAGGFDTIGGNTLATILKSIYYGGNVITVGNIESGNLNTTVYPFIIRGIKLIGVATQETPMDLREKLWGLLSNEWKLSTNEIITTEINLGDLAHYLDLMINKKSRGRILLNLWD